MPATYAALEGLTRHASAALHRCKERSCGISLEALGAWQKAFHLIKLVFSAVDGTTPRMATEGDAP